MDVSVLGICHAPVTKSSSLPPAQQVTANKKRGFAHLCGIEDIAIRKTNFEASYAVTGAGTTCP